MIDIGIGAALLAGLLSFVSPCVLPIVPSYLAYLAGISVKELTGDDVPPGMARRIVAAAMMFVLGFTTVFVAFGATASTIGQALAQHFDTLAVIAGLVIIVMGFHFLGVFRIGLLFREMRFSHAVKPSDPAGSYVMGLAFAFGWTPCIGPVLAAILFVAGAEDTIVRGALLLAAYSLGIGIPFLAAALFAGRFLRWMAGFRRHLGMVEKVVGALLVVTGILFMTGSMSLIAWWLVESFPAFQTIG